MAEETKEAAKGLSHQDKADLLYDAAISGKMPEALKGQIKHIGEAKPADEPAAKVAEETTAESKGVVSEVKEGEKPADKPVDKPAEATVQAEGAKVAVPTTGTKEEALEAFRRVTRGETAPTITIPTEVETWAKANGSTAEELASLPILRDNAKKAEEAIRVIEDYNKRYAAAPPQARMILDMIQRGSMDWKQVASSPTTQVDYSKPFEKQDAKEMLEVFAQGKVTAEQWAAADGNPKNLDNYELLSELCKDRFEKQKGEYEKYFTKEQQANEQFHEQLKGSRQKSLNQFQYKMPGINISTLLPEADKTLTHEGIQQLFFENASTLRPEAAEYVALILNHKVLFDAPLAKATKEAKDAAELEVIRRTPEKLPTTQKTGTPAGKMVMTADEALEYLHKNHKMS